MLQHGSTTPRHDGIAPSQRVTNRHKFVNHRDNTVQMATASSIEESTSLVSHSGLLSFKPDGIVCHAGLLELTYLFKQDDYLMCPLRQPVTDRFFQGFFLQ